MIADTSLPDLILAVGTAGAALVGAIFAGWAKIIAARAQKAAEAVHEAVKTPNGDPRSIGEIAADVAAATPGATQQDAAAGKTPSTEPHEAG